VEISTSWPYKRASELTLSDLKDYKVIRSVSAFCGNLGEEFTALNRILYDVLYRRIQWSKVWFPDEKHQWYNKHPDTVLEKKFNCLVRDFEDKLCRYDEIYFYHNPGRFHPLYRMLNEVASRTKYAYSVTKVRLCEMSGMNEPAQKLCGWLREQLERLPLTKYPFNLNQLPRNGIYFFYEKGETWGHHGSKPRIVRIGTHKSNNFRSRARDTPTSNESMTPVGTHGNLYISDMPRTSLGMLLDILGGQRIVCTKNRKWRN
jgi:hypothetical protein